MWAYVRLSHVTRDRNACSAKRNKESRGKVRECQNLGVDGNQTGDSSWNRSRRSFKPPHTPRDNYKLRSRCCHLVDSSNGFALGLKAPPLKINSSDNQIPIRKEMGGRGRGASQTPNKRIVFQSVSDLRQDHVLNAASFKFY